jgi:large subunit ribosomal protein L15
MPIHRRLPKRGFTNIFKKTVVVVNVDDLARFESGATVDEGALVEAGLVKGKRCGVKLLAKGQIDRALTVKVHAVSDGARKKIEAAGGKVEVI